MENYPPYTYPDSATSSPRSREPDFDPNPNPNPNPNPPSSWEDQPNPNQKVKFMVSYNGKIQPRSHDNLLSYIGGDTKILSVDRSVKFSVIYSKLASLVSQLESFDGVDFSFKYQLPGEDLDALISVTNDDDLEHMMHEYDRLWKGNSKPARLRLFLFFDNKSKNHNNHNHSAGDAGSAFSSVSSEQGKLPDRGLDRLVSDPVNNNVDFLFGLDKVLPVHVPGPNPDQINEMNRVHLLQMQQQQLQQSGIYAAKNEGNFVDQERKSPQMGNFAGNIQQQLQPPPQQPPQMPPGYWQQIEQQQQLQQQFLHQPQQLQHEFNQQPPQQPPLFMMHASPPPPLPGNIFHGGAGMMQQPNQGFYQHGNYMDQQQPVYTTPANIPAMMPAVNTATAVAQIRPGDGGGYGQVAYDNATGRQVYYTAAPPQGVVAPPYSGVTTTVVGGGGGVGEMRGSGDGKVVPKIVTNPNVV